MVMIHSYFKGPFGESFTRSWGTASNSYGSSAHCWIAMCFHCPIVATGRLSWLQETLPFVDSCSFYAPLVLSQKVFQFKPESCNFISWFSPTEFHVLYIWISSIYSQNSNSTTIKSPLRKTLWVVTLFNPATRFRCHVAGHTRLVPALLWAAWGGPTTHAAKVGPGDGSKAISTIWLGE